MLDDTDVRAGRRSKVLRMGLKLQRFNLSDSRDYDDAPILKARSRREVERNFALYA